MEYNASAIETLSFRDAVATRISMYMGSADNQGVLQGIREIITNAIDEYTMGYGNKIEVVFCNNDAMALGAAAAITAAGRTVGKDIYLVGVDALAECQEMVQKGEMTGTVLNDHIAQSHAAVDVAIDLLNGKEIKNYYWIDYVMVR